MFKMSQKLNLPRILKKGDKKVITIEEVVTDCIIVSMIYQNRKYCGALMDTTKRRGPFGIGESNDENKDATTTKVSPKAPFPQPLLTRHSYKQDVVQPPLPKLSCKLRKCRRKPSASASENARNVSKKPQNMQTKQDSTASKPASVVLGKRKATNSEASDNNAKLSKLAKSDHTDDLKSDLPVKIASPTRHLKPQEEYDYSTCAIVKIEQKSFDDELDSPFGGSFFEHINNFKKHMFNCSGLAAEQNGAISNPVQSSHSSCESKPKIVDVTKCSIKHKTRKSKSIKLSKVVDAKSELTNIKDTASEQEKLAPLKNTPKRSTRKRKSPQRFSEIEDYESAAELSSKTNQPKSNSSSSPIQDFQVLVLPLDEATADPRLNFKKGSQSKKSGLVNFDSIDRKIGHVTYANKCKVNGVTFNRGDIVWGKLKGYPWWPCRIVKLIVTKNNDDFSRQEALVGWFDFKSTSILPLHSLQLFQENFSARYEKKRRGIYQKAVANAKRALKSNTSKARKLISQLD